MRLRFAAALASLLTFSPARAQPLSTAFTYQGELSSAGAAANGLYDIRFLLFDNISAGTQVGPTLCSDNISVVNGRFSVQLDFGAQFAGQQRFLELWVRPDTGVSCGSLTGFAILGPRQPLTASPNAVFALNATSAASATTATTAATATNATQLNGQAASFYQNAANLSSGTIPDARISGAYSGVLTLNNAGNVFAGSGAGLTSVNASLLNGLSSTAFLQSVPTPLTLSATISSSHVIRGENASPTSFATGVLGIATAASGTTIGVEGAAVSSDGIGVYGQASASTGSTYGGQFVSVSSTGYGVRGTGSVGVLGDSSTTSGRGVWGLSSSTTGRGMFGQASATTGVSYGVYGQAASSTDNAAGVFGTATAASGTTFGVRGECASPAGFGVMGYSALSNGVTTGVHGRSESTSGRGVYGLASAATGVNSGVRGDTLSTSGTGVFGLASAISGQTYGVQGTTISTSDTAAGVFGIAAAASGASFGVEGRADSSTGIGVLGVSTASTGWTYGVYGESNSASDNSAGLFGTARGASGITFGVRGESTSPSGFGVFGYSALTAGAAIGVYGRTDSTTGRGVVGVAVAGTGVSYGLLGSTNSPIGWGVFSLGNTGAGGTKSFRIDHPADPTNKYLLHYSTESPEVLNIYRGTIRLDSQGGAVVDLPAYFASINKDPSYTLTAVGSPMPMLHIAAEISDDALTEGANAQPGQPVPACSFSIAGGVPNGRVSWRVEACRNDKWVQQRGAPVEVEKQGLEKGSYQNPELYNQPAEKSFSYSREASLAPR